MGMLIMGNNEWAKRENAATDEQREKLDRARKLVRAATGEDWGDGYIVTDVGIGIAEPGYEHGAIWVLGDWNTKRYRRDGDPPLTPAETLPQRLGNALDRFGIETLWLDEWIRCDECSRVFRTVEDSYSWRMSGLITEDGDVVCADDITYDDIEETYLDNPRVALTFDIDLAAHGFTRYEEYGNRGRYENGWHPGQNDKPEDVLARAQSEGLEGIFKIPAVGQFHIEFELWVRAKEEIRTRLEELREIIKDESISYGEILELENLAAHIPDEDVELLQWANVPEFPDDEE